jgi:hypothetical protein
MTNVRNVTTSGTYAATYPIGYKSQYPDTYSPSSFAHDASARDLCVSEGVIP